MLLIHNSYWSSIVINHQNTMGNHIPAPQNRIPYPKDVWSPTGGWYANPKNWRRNTAFAFAFVIVSSALVFKFSADHEVIRLNGIMLKHGIG